MQTHLKYLLLSIIILLTLCAFNGSPNDPTRDKFVIVLDAGHGGKDPGRPTSYGFKEKDIALSVVLRVGKLLERHKDIKVIYTRKKDKFVELRERARIANKADADLFVSIHCNAHNSQAYGTETYVLGLHVEDANFNVAKQENEVIFLEDNYEKHYEGFDPNSPESLIGLTLLQEDYLDQSIQLASHIQDNFTHKLKRRNRGVKQAGFWVLHNTYMPSVLVETGFITNKNEGKYLNSEKGKQEMSKAIADAILKYKSEVNYDMNEGILAEDEAEEASTTEADIYPNITFKVQIAASSRKLEPASYNFNGLTDISREQNGKMYRYFYGETSDLNEIKSKKTEAIKKGYGTAFIVAYKNGERIPLNKVF